MVERGCFFEKDFLGERVYFFQRSCIVEERSEEGNMYFVEKGYFFMEIGFREEKFFLGFMFKVIELNNLQSFLENRIGSEIN